MVQTWNPSFLPLYSAVSNSSHGALCTSFSPGVDCPSLPWDKCLGVMVPASKPPHVVLSCPDNFLQATPQVECTYLSPWTNLAFFNTVISPTKPDVCATPNMEFMSIPTGQGLISTFMWCIRSLLINSENIHAEGIFKLHEQTALSTLAAFIYIPVNVVLRINYSYVFIKAVIISSIKMASFENTLFVFPLIYIVLPIVCQNHSYFRIFLIGSIEKV